MRSDSKLSGYRYSNPRGFDQQNSYISNRSNGSVHSEHLRKMMDDVQMYPSGFAELLKYEQRNIKTFKAQINREKERVNDDMMSFKTQVNHILEDLRLSLHAHLDRIYQGYIEKYAKFKGEILEINRLKDQIEIQCGSSINLPAKSSRDHINNSTLAGSNIQTISQMQNGVKQLKKYHFLNYISELQKQRILPLHDLQREIVILNEYCNGYYQPKQFQGILQGLKQFIIEEVHRVYDNSHLYIREVDAILFKQQPRILDEVYERPPPREIIVERPPPQRIISEPVPVYSAPRVATEPSIAVNRTQRPVATFAPQPTVMGSPIYGEVGSSQQAVKVDWVEKVNLVDNNKFRLGSQVVLCGLSLGNQRLAFGFKDGTIQIMTNEGQIVSTLKEHKASICTLSLVRIRGQTYLASGSDIGCSKIIIWDMSTWQPLDRFENHKAAVTAIVDLQDDTHVLSGSYDKKINVYNVEQGRFLYNLPANQTPVTGAIINKSGNRVITCGLDKALNVWQVSRTNGKVDTLFLQRKIENNVLICSMVASAWQNDIVVIGTKDGKIKMINVAKGQSYKTISCGDNNLIELLLIQRDSKPFYPIVLAWPFKENKLHIVNSQSSAVTTKTCSSFLQFGCGVSPKCFFLQKGGNICSVSHSEQAKQVTIYKLQELK